MLTAPLGDRDRRLFDRFAIEAIEKVDAPPQGTGPDASVARQRWILELFGRRHSLYRQVITTRDFTHALLTDTRDVIVTADLEDNAHASKLLLSQEDVTTSLSQEPYNRRWIQGGYGDAGLAAIGSKPILCAGTVFGPRAAIADYLLAMEREVERIGVQTTREIGDQPLHNHLAYSGGLPPYAVSRAEDGWMRSIGIQRREDVRLDWDAGQQTRTGHLPCAIVHQYDRHLGTATIRHAVARVAGLPLVHPWRLHAYRDNGRDLGARILRRMASSVASLSPPAVVREAH